MIFSQADNNHLNLEELYAPAQTEFTTSTIWLDCESHFAGVLFKDLLNYITIKGKNTEVITLDGYEDSMPIADLENNA